MKKNNNPYNPLWHPNTSVYILKKRSEILAKIRQFFADNNVIEVETPILSQYTVTDIHLIPFKTQFIGSGDIPELTLYMIASPEYHMKRLLASGSGSIYQLGRSFRNGEIGRLHNPEFTMLEWYRPGYNMQKLIHEVDAFLQLILCCKPSEMLSYQQAFIRYLEIDPLTANKKELRLVARRKSLSNISDNEDDIDDLLQLLFVSNIEPRIGHDKPVFIYNYPASQSALARINLDDPRISERFEVYYKGIELANGFDELTDNSEQQKRFENENNKRIKLGLAPISIDEHLVAALQYGLTACSGVAIGVDRLIMLALNEKKISDVMSFTIGIA